MAPFPVAAYFQMDVQPWKMERSSPGGPRGSKRESDSSHEGNRRPKSRIRRSMTACNTCRKLKTRCDLEPRSHACRRCLSLRIDCELPEASERQQDNWSDAGIVSSSIEERLTSLEKSMSELTSMMRQVMQTSATLSRSPRSRLKMMGNVETGESVSDDNFHPPKPMHLITELQSEFFGEKYDFISEAHHQGDIITQGLVDLQQANMLIQLFVEHFGRSVSIYTLSDLPPNLRQNNPFLFSTACLLASRYLPDIPLSAVHAMYLQVRRQSANVLWSAPPLSLRSLQALCLLCLWSATVQTEIPMDSWLLSGISINHAIISFDFLDQLLAEPVLTDDVIRKLRVWNALCLTQLHCAIGNARPFNLKQRYLEYCHRILESPAARFEDARQVAEIQLYSLTLALQGDYQRIQKVEIEYEELSTWKRNWAHLLIDEAQAVSLNLGFWFCNLLLHRTTLRVLPESDKLVSEVIKSARHILSTLIQIQPGAAVSYIDHLFFVSAYAALTLCEYDIANPIIDQIQIQLIHISPNEEHIAYRFACVIGELKRRLTQVVHAAEASPVIMRRTVNATPGPAAPMLSSSSMNTVPVGYGSLQQLLTGFVSAPAVPTAGYALPPSCGMSTPGIVQQHHHFQSPLPE